MPFESIVVVGLVVALFVVFAATLGWARWYAGAAPPTAKQSDTPAE